MSPLKHITVIVILSSSNLPSPYTSIFQIVMTPTLHFACHIAQQVKVNTHASSVCIIHICMDKRSNFCCLPGQNAARMRCLRRKKKHGRIERNFERKPSLEDDCFVKSLLELFEFSNNKVLKPRNSAMTD